MIFSIVNLNFVSDISHSDALYTSLSFLSSTASQVSRMAWCTCPVRCKGGREVAERTRTKHEKELHDKERQRLDQIFFPGRTLPPSVILKRRHHDEDDVGDTSSKRARRNDQQQSEAEARPALVRISINLSQLRLTSR